MWFLTTFTWASLILIVSSHIGEMVLDPTPCNNPNDFQCNDGTCIHKQFRCDDSTDCPDKSDELECDLYLCRPPYYRCRNNTLCIQSSEICDTYYDCPMLDDEENCPYLKEFNDDLPLSFSIEPELQKECNEYEFTCANSNCISKDLICDGINHCIDNSDENPKLCKKEEKNCKGFLCKNDECLSSILWKCDGKTDCTDGSDEIGCTQNCTTEYKQFLCKDRVTCINLDQVCNEHNDCPDESDEGGTCKANQCAQMKCPNECHNLPTGSICTCTKGYEYNAKTNSCNDIDECSKIYGICSQQCENTNGSYKCSCVDRFSLDSDGRTCNPIGDSKLVFGARSKVYMYSIGEKTLFEIKGNLSNTMGIHFDGLYVYWTDISKNMVTLQRSHVDRTNRDVWLMIGINSPEDLTVDWLTGNFYFTDRTFKHIGVCSYDGYNCAALVTKSIDQPKAIVLNPLEGVMYWTEGGNTPMIARSSMDGSDVVPIVTDDLHSPNGLCLDWPNDRLYWVDTKMKTIESINLKDNTRNLILSDAPKHPLGIGIIGDRLFWSDSGTRDIQSCDKFTGKHRSIEIKKKKVYHLHIYHPGLMPKRYYPCMKNPCSHICLTNSNKSYTCACPPGMELGPDKSTCFKNNKESMIIMTMGSYVITLHQQRFGRLKSGNGFEYYDLIISRIAYNSLTGNLFIADNVQGIIFDVDIDTKRVKKLIVDTKNVTALAFDYLANNLYWTDAERNTVELYSIQNQQHTIVTHFVGTEIPIALAVLPEHGNMLIGLHSDGHTHIDMLSMSGRGNHHHMIEEGLGSRGSFSFHVDDELQVLFWNDQSTNKIESSDFEGQFRHTYRNKYVNNPVAVTTIDENLYWTSARKNILYYSNKYDSGKYTLEIPLTTPPRTPKPDQILLAAATPLRAVTNHPCVTHNGGCSDICVTLGKFESACLCQPGYIFENFKNKTCIKHTDCEFRCGSGECITMNRRCNQHKDCADNSDEKNCKNMKPTQLFCSYDMYKCESGTACIPKTKLCDHFVDCDDKSDESESVCRDIDPKKKCLKHQFSCPNGRCIDGTQLCDGVDDCEDNTDEDKEFCNNVSPNGCGKDMFRCSTGQCIPKSWECDGYLDCNDASDEHLLCEHGVCPTNFFKCKTSYECVPNTMVCNNEPDCKDGSDENECHDLCPEGKFACKMNTSICVDDVARCNGTAECPKGEDEMDCRHCSIYEFQCRNGTCIYKDFHCDGHNDCKDGSDELDCDPIDIYREPTNRECIAGTFSCKDGTCIDNTKVCDGTPDCHNDWDESGKCNVTCVDDNPCEHRCQKSPYGPVCSCDPGFELAGNHKECKDIDECQMDNPCAQKCENTIGSYQCSCYSDYMIRNDKITCKSFGSAQYLVYSMKNELRKMTFNPQIITTIHTISDNKFIALDVNIPKSLLYFSIDNYETLFQLNLDTNAIMNFNVIGMPTKIAVDWVTDNIYYINQYADSPSIQACHMTKTRNACVKIKEFRRNDRIGALVVDPINRYLFYAILHYRPMGIRDLVIYRTRLDGSGLEVVLHNVYDVSAMAIDYNRKLLYFTDKEKNSLHSVKYDGNDTKVVIKKVSTIHKPISINIFEDHAYILNEGSQNMVKCSLYGHPECQPLDLVMNNVKHMVIVQESRQQIIRNVCENKCQYMCVQSDIGAKCLCPKGNHVPDNVQCEGHVEKIGNLSAPQTSSTSGVTIFFVVFLCVIVVFTGLFVLYKKRYHQGRFNISMHFENPSLHNIDAAKVNMVNPPEILCSSRRNEVSNQNFSPFVSEKSGGSNSLQQKPQQRIVPSNVFDALDDDISLEDESDSFDDNPRKRLIL